MNEIRMLELFGGIGAIKKAFERQNIPHKVIDYVEIDKYAVASYNAMFNAKFNVSDVKEWDKNIEVDFIMHGSPCQDFSVAGKQAGGDLGSGTRSSLMYETIRIVGKLRPKYVMWENVKNLLSKKHKHNFDAYIETMNILGYNSYYQVLNAKDYGIPQNRERVYTISIRKDIDKGTFTFPEKEELKLRLKDILENEVDEKYYLNEAQIERIKRVYSQEGVSPTLTDMQGGNRQPKILVKNATKKGYDEANDGDSINLAYPDSKTRRGRVGHQVSQTIQCNDSMGVVENINKNAKHQQDLVQSINDICRTIPAGTHGSTPHLLKTIVDEQPLKIRKLTPKECWRLMGFDDIDFERAARVNSNTQLYKQAGNSIVVNVLEKILQNLFKEEQ